MGHELRVFAGQGSATVRVHAVVDDGGKGAFALQPNLFMRLSEAQRFLNASGQINALFVSNVGGVRDGHTVTDQAVAELDHLIGKRLRRHNGK